jgi:uncharacterized protein YukE
MAVSNEMIDVKQRIEALLAGLKLPTERIESVFLNVGGELSACVELLQRAKKTFEELPEELNSPLLDEASGRLGLVGQRVSAIAEEMAVSLKDLELLGACLARAESPIDALRRIVKTIGMVAINVRVGVANLDVNREDFGAFATEVSDLARSMTDSVSDLHQTYQAMTTVVREAAKVWAGFMKAQRDPLLAVGREFSTTLDAVTSQRRTSSERSAETSRMSRSIVEKLGNTVMALQSGDSLRQRLEHVDTALRNVLTGAVEGTALSPLFELERLQLEGARIDLGQEMETARVAVDQLAEDSQTMLDQARIMHGSGENSHSALDELRNVVEGAVAVLGKSEAERKNLDRVAVEVSNTVKRLLEQVELVGMMEHQMRIVSLNATIKSSKLDRRGRALNVVAQQLRDLTKEIGIAAEGAIGKLREVSEVSAEFAKSIDASDSNALAALETEAADGLESLERVSRRLGQAMTDLSRDVPGVKHKLRHVVTLLGESRTISTEVADAETMLQDLGAEPGDVSAQSSFYSNLRLVYTMNAERSIHDEFTGLEPETPLDVAQHSADQSAESALEDLLF